MLKLKKRLKNYQIDNKNANFQYALRSTGKPCSCFVCQQPEDNYDRMAFKKEAVKEIKAETLYDRYDCEELEDEQEAVWDISYRGPCLVEDKEYSYLVFEKSA